MVQVKVLDSFNDYGKVVSISNGIIEAFVTVDLGPRIVRFGYVNGQNFMRDDRNAFELKNDDEFTNFFGEGKAWNNYGGHRIWTSPEAYPDTYYPDNDPVKYELLENGAIFTPNPEIETGMAKQLEVRMDDNDCNMQVTMRVTNIDKADKEFAIWGLTVSNRGGTLIIPMNTNDTGLLSNRVISVWPYTDMSDKRLYWGKTYFTVAQDATATEPLKLGFDLNCGTLYYCLNDEIFCKRYETKHPIATYPDGGCSFETYTNDQFIEIESLGELHTVHPGETDTLTENWSLMKKPCDVDFKSDNSIDNLLTKI